MREQVLQKTKISRKKSREFTHDDILAFITLDKYPIIDIYPFSSLHNFSLQKKSVTISLEHPTDTVFSGKDIIPHIRYIDNISVTEENILQLSFSVFNLIYYEYMYHVTRWSQYFYDNLQTFCDSYDSTLFWNTFKHSKKSSIINTEKATWITICTAKDREFWTKFTISIRESLLPWMNPEMYKRVKDNENAKRVNVDYDKHRRAMYAGNLKDMDIKTPESTEELDNLDVVR